MIYLENFQDTHKLQLALYVRFAIFIWTTFQQLIFSKLVHLVISQKGCNIALAINQGCSALLTFSSFATSYAEGFRLELIT